MNIRDIDLNLLLVFEVVYAERNLSRAARTIGISQSAVSNALARLRDTLGQPLFVRAGQGVAPTPYAESVAADISNALAILRNALQESAFDFHLSERRFTLICSDYSAALILPAVQRRVEELAPHVTLQVIARQDSAGFDQALAQGEADLAVGGLPFLGGATRQQRLFDEHTVVLARQGHPATMRRVDPSVLNHYPHVLVNPYGNWQPWEQLLQEGAAIDPRIAIRLPTYLAVPYLLESSDHLAACPGRLATLLMRNFPLKILKLPSPIGTVPIGQYWHERTQEDPGHQWLRQLVHDLCRDM